ncbi:FCD domain-containing protein [Pseudooceanicola sp. 216_PA32_1]|jgi:DNA-binding GntR family transcriptional regulator|uniref:FCD domain-containing protein n=1 Tax=Pseudooceanicola pacificus TaxID=2676438 RepID=A0A844W6R6_9RHOB|nr:GntR family transcriptional regulator [Pseudooceanicola pacificus]MWB78775.1 FCD domain-containing protein [Pseudooceanicola pacificus]
MTSDNGKPGFERLAREGLVERVAALLSNAIVTGKLAPGARLSESVVARDLGVSRAPVREAARLLESSGLVAYVPNRGFFVRQVSADAIDDLYELRLVIETAAVRRLIRGDTGPVIANLSRQVDELYRIADLGPDFDMLTQVQADIQFHRLLVAASGNPKLLAVFEQIATETEFSIMIVGQLYDDPHRIAETHLPIIDALRDGDEMRAVEALRFHIVVAQRVVTQKLRQLEKEQST